MANDTVTALENALKDLVKEKGPIEVMVKKYQEEVIRVQNVMADAQERAKCADYERRVIERDLGALRSLYNRLVEKPRTVRLRIEKLQGDHQPAFAKSQAAHKAVQDQELVLREAQTRLGVAQEAEQEFQAQYQELSDLLQKETNKL
jgi:hypothetical protein